MRKHHKQQLLELVKSLGDAHRELERLSRRGRQEDFVALLADCQDSAQFIGEYIEAQVGKGTTPVAGLVHYCDLLFEASQAERAEQGSHLKKLEKQRVAIDKAIRQDLPAKSIEVLFMPYKASMWDSLESIWLAACRDPDCTPIVMPVHYFDMLPNGQKGQMQYDGTLFPPEVTVTPYSEYDIAQQHPDVIVIHNPYDGENLVTRLPREYYSEHLRELTDLLVYSPYFVTAGHGIKEHHAFLPGVRYADVVVATSEEQRQAYIRYFKKLEREHRCVGRFGDIEKKCVALGSPKYDKVLHTRREDCQLPDAWRRLIDGPDGTRRKVILYNTTVADLLKGNDMSLRKLRYVFSRFKGRDDVVLWWRPHPLNVATCQSMRPQLYAAYTAIVREYVAEGWGIYDDTADLPRAMAVADAYYGDSSSLVPLFSATGKPVILQNPSIVTQEDRSNQLAPSCLCDDGEYLWFSEYYYNALYRVKKGAREAEYMGSFPGEEMNGIHLFSGVTAWENKLLFAPCNAAGLAIYDKTSGQFIRVPLDPPDSLLADAQVSKLKFYGCALFDDWLYLTPFNSMIFARYHLGNRAIEYISDMLPPPAQKKPATGVEACFLRPCVVGNRLFLAFRFSPNVLELDMANGKLQRHKVNGTVDGFTGLCHDGEAFWLTPHGNGPVIRWDGKSVTHRLTDYPPGFSAAQNTNSLFPVFRKGKVHLLPAAANMAVCVNAQEKKLEEDPAFGTEHTMAPGKYLQYLFAAASEHALYTYSLETGRLAILHEGDDEAVQCIITYPDSQAAHLAAARSNPYTSGHTSQPQAALREIHLRPLSALLDALTSPQQPPEAQALRDRQIDLLRQRTALADGTSGQAIYDLCRERLS